MRDTHGFDEFYRATSPRMLRYAVALTGDPTEAEDAVQEAYARAWRRWQSVSSHPAPEAWVRLTVSRLTTDRWRRMFGLRSALTRRGPADEAVGAPSEDSVLLMRALRQLPANQRQALARHYLYDMSIEAIADESSVATGTVKSWLSRGRARLAVILADLAPQRTLEVHDV
ncbi:SigE family RNA polymerase sigma factor [Plantactinospora sp. S1510]|uniref:SigE family RNA polymerase sigma factor n=1 Tax=Plantactinospora alkalitolerans TaxID=2789879 RepID=A0ABS0H8W1_9ACTN|nr:SigE family RNA polymerase sigma factor [Plantactinospora alkalitolerans]MBF9134618.1 SigE family RNA polymerase sigma factor [Plantactinospora alkalitolerans]